MNDRFVNREITTSEQEKVQVEDASVSVHFNMNYIISGREGEFLRLKLDYGDDIERNVTIVVKGIDKKGNDLYEEFNW